MRLCSSGRTMLRRAAVVGRLPAEPEHGASPRVLERTAIEPTQAPTLGR
jgi:hypothetical protein